MHSIRLAAAALLLVASPLASAAERQAPATAAEVQLSFSPVVKRVAPAVVNVYATRMVRQPRFPDLFSQLFGSQLFDGPFQQSRPRVQQSLGSGVVVSPDGVIVTNLHVVEDADEVKVALNDKREFAADIVFKSDRSDLAILRIKEKVADLPTLTFADIDSVSVGDLVLAIGDPFGVGQSVTSGIVSAFASVPGRPTEDQYFIQTDAAINPGNSGGALVDMEGRLIGINRFIYSNSGQSAGIGFAIPSDVVRSVLAAALHGGAVQRPWLGAQLQEMTPDLAASFGMDRPGGVLVTSIDAGSPAARAGLKENDLVVAFNGHDVSDLASLGFRLATATLGQTADVDFVRDHQRYTVKLPLEAAPENPPRDRRVISGDSPFSGLTVLNLSPAVAEELALPAGADKGVVVGDIASGSVADRIGFEKGDVIATINNVTVDSTRKLEQVAGSAPRLWDLTVKRGNSVLHRQFPG